DAFMDKAQAKAAAAAAAAAASALAGNSPAQVARDAQTAADAVDSDAYAYVPGRPFGQYAAEQIAEQVEHNYLGRHVAATTPIVAKVRSLSANVNDADNVLSLATPRFERNTTPGVVFP